MQTIQKLIKQLMKSPEESLFLEITERLKTAEVLYAAYTNASRNYYIGLEHGEVAAYLFTEKSYFEEFRALQQERGVTLEIVENKVQHRTMLLADLYRSGVTVLMIDSGQQLLAVSLFEFVKPPTSSEKQQDATLVMNTKLLAKADYFFQQVSCRRADSDDELDMFHEIHRGSYLIPIKTADSKGTLPVMKQKDGKSLMIFFTDLTELRKYDKRNEYSAIRGSFREMKELCEKADGIVINPLGFRLVLDAQLLQAIEDAENGRLILPKERIVMSESDEITLHEAGEQSADMTAQIAAFLKEKKEVNAAYLCTMTKSTAVRSSYLFILDATRDTQELYREIAKIAVPLANGMDLEFLSYRESFGKEAASITEPFYKKKRFRLFG